MKAQFETEDIQAIAQAVWEMLKPLLAGNGKQGAEDTILDVSGLADYLKVSKQWVYERTSLKEIPHFKIYGHLRFSKRQIEKWLSAHTVPPVSTPARALKSVRR